MAFRESDGQFLWQAVHDKLAAGRANDWPFQGICSSPLVENGVVYYVSNRGEVMAVDIQGFRDNGENDGPFKDEKQTRETDVDIIWRYDMMDELGVMQHNMANSSPVMYENLIYVSTSNGQDESHVNVPSPKSPAIIALDKTTGKLVWEEASPGEKILHGQWSSAAVGKVGDTVQVVVGQGDGWVRWLRGQDRQEAVGVRSQSEGLGLAEDAQRGDQHAGHLRRRRLHRQRPGPGARRGRRAPLRDRSDQARRHHPVRAALALRQDPPIDLHRRDLQRHPVLLRLQRLPARGRRQDRQAVLDARHVRRHLGIADGDRRQGLPRRRGWGRHGAQRRSQR